MWAPVFLSLTLLATDPATMPRTGPGRAIFGALLGVGFLVAASILVWLVGMDFYGKVVPLTFVNLLVPWCDRAGERMHQAVRRALAPEHNRAHILAWMALVVYSLRGDLKRGAFEPREHEAADTPLIVRDEAGA